LKQTPLYHIFKVIWFLILVIIKFLIINKNKRFSYFMSQFERATGKNSNTENYEKK
jgi:hypothetical protein